MKFNEKLIALRKKHVFTQEDLAEKLGVSRQAVSRWEAGDTTPEMVLLKEICNVFNISADYLLNDDVENENDIPIIKSKNEEIKIVKTKNRKNLLVLVISFAVASAFTNAGIITATSTAQRIASCFLTSSFVALMIVSLIKYFRK